MEIAAHLSGGSQWRYNCTSAHKDRGTVENLIQIPAVDIALSIFVTSRSNHGAVILEPHRI